MLLAGCPAKGPPVPVDAGLPAVGAGADAGVEAADAAVAALVPAVPVPVPFTVALARADGGVEVASPDEAGVAEVDTSAEVLVSVDAPVSDVRVRLFDWSDRIVPSDDEAQPSDGGVAYRISLAEPLRAGRTYRLTIDAQVGARLVDARGHPYEDGQIQLSVRGDVEPDPKPPPKRKPAKGKKRR